MHRQQSKAMQLLKNEANMIPAEEINKALIIDPKEMETHYSSGKNLK